MNQTSAPNIKSNAGLSQAGGLMNPNSDPLKSPKSDPTLEITNSEVNRMIQARANFNLIDVRSSTDFAKEHITNAVNMPTDQWDAHAALSKDRLNVLYCGSAECPLSRRAAERFALDGYHVKHIVGGLRDWKGSGFSTSNDVGATRETEH